MKLHFNFLDNIIEISDEFVKCIEVENNNYFIRMVTILNNYCNQIGETDELIIEDNNKLDLIIDYFNIINNKKDITNIMKYIETKVGDADYEKIRKQYNKINDVFISLIDEFDLPIIVNPDYSVSKLLKLLNISIKNTDSILQNILTYIDINMLLQQKVLIFINLKSYLSKVELLELYKYCIYNNVKIMLIDNKLYGITLDYEKKLIIDCNLEEVII